MVPGAVFLVLLWVVGQAKADELPIDQYWFNELCSIQNSECEDFLFSQMPILACQKKQCDVPNELCTAELLIVEDVHDNPNKENIAKLVAVADCTKVPKGCAELLRHHTTKKPVYQTEKPDSGAKTTEMPIDYDWLYKLEETSNHECVHWVVTNMPLLACEDERCQIPDELCAVDAVEVHHLLNEHDPDSSEREQLIAAASCSKVPKVCADQLRHHTTKKPVAQTEKPDSGAKTTVFSGVMGLSLLFLHLRQLFY